MSAVSEPFPEFPEFLDVVKSYKSILLDRYEWSDMCEHSAHQIMQLFQNFQNRDDTIHQKFVESCKFYQQTTEEYVKLIDQLLSELPQKNKNNNNNNNETSLKGVDNSSLEPLPPLPGSSDDDDNNNTNKDNNNPYPYLQADEVQIAHLVSDYAALQGQCRRLHEDKEALKELVTQLESSLQTSISENNALRSDLSTLQLQAVPFDVYEEKKMECRHLQHQIELLKKETEILALELEKNKNKEQLSMIPFQNENMETIHHIVEKKLGDSAVEDNNNNNNPHNVGLWSLAVKELEDQALLSVSLQHYKEECAEHVKTMELLKTELEQVQKEKKQLEEENSILRDDAQEYVYKNSILSTQMTSLLVKVEKLKHALRIKLNNNNNNNSDSESLSDLLQKGGRRGRNVPSQRDQHS
ncbi:hypothetical protein ADEAN_000940800 [Angomonas deanei]|uniref:Uncharacterized protein n=1 Tax=Angomonas deanei TaxID=59799 RepID=A0A7G2CTU0_9TRYP|nr:hypothetical protein ADEAN_000940800 [Angomonas deanei]